jgi:hypothetical protein
LIVEGPPIPGYGCRECGLKALYVPFDIEVLLAAAELFAQVGDDAEADRLRESARIATVGAPVTDESAA